jgi:hypothetical protein
MSKTLVKPLVAAAVILAMAFVLNPSPERHRLKIKESIGERNVVARTLGLGSLAALASTYHSLGVASYTTAGERTLSLGLMGIVYVPE